MNKSLLFFIPALLSLPLGLTGQTAEAMPAQAVPAKDPVPLDPCVVISHQAANPLTVVADPKAPAQPIPSHDGADFLKSVPGFSVIRKGGTDGDPVLRGMAGSRVGIQLDDECCYGGCGNRMDPPTAYVFPAAYDRVTIIKGPQSVLHGPGNSAGVVIFEHTPTRFASPQAQGQTSLTAGSFGRLDGLIDANAGGPSAQARVTGTYTRADNYEDGSGTQIHSAYKRWSSNASAAWTPDGDTFIEVNGALSDGEAAYADRSMDGVKFDRSSYGIRARRSNLGEVLKTLEIRAYRNYVDHVMDNHTLRPFIASMMMPNPAVSNPDRLTRGALIQATIQPLERMELVLGADAQENRHTLRSTMNETSMPYEVMLRSRDADFRQRGVFGEATWTLSESSKLVAGLRTDFWKATDSRKNIAVSMMSTVPNPGAGHVRKSELSSGFARYEKTIRGLPVPATLYFGLGQSQRFPDYWEMIKNESASSVTAFGIKPETTRQLDTGILLKGAGYEISASLFASDVSDFILVQSGVSKASGMMGTRTAVISRNIDACTYGGELSALWRLKEHWRLEGSLAYVRGSNDTDNRPLAQLPPLERRLGLSYATENWSVGGLVRTVSRQDRFALNQGNIVGQDLGATPGFSIVSLNAGRSFGDRFRLTGGIDNLFGKTYAEHISRAGAAVAGFLQGTRVNEPGRLLWLKLEAKF